MMFLNMKMESATCVKRIFMKDMLIYICQNFPMAQYSPLDFSYTLLKEKGKIICHPYSLQIKRKILAFIKHVTQTKNFIALPGTPRQSAYIQGYSVLVRRSPFNMRDETLLFQTLLTLFMFFYAIILLW